MPHLVALIILGIMNATTKKWTSGLDHLTTAFTAAFGHLDGEALNRKPNPSVWSIAQVIDHIIKVNETYYPIVHQLKDGTYKLPWTARFPFLVNWFGDFIYKGVEPERRKKIKTFPIWEPAQSEVGADILARFAQHQKEMAYLMDSCKAYIQAGKVISSPANRFIVYTLSRAFDIMVAHEQRHFNQALEIKEKLKIEN